MEHSHRGFAWKASLTLLIILFILPAPTTIDIPWVSGADGPGPLSQEPTSRTFVGHKHADKGFTLIAPYNRKYVNLVDYDGAVIHTWRSDRTSRGTVELLEDGTLLRGRSGSNDKPDGIHILDWDGSVLWDYQPPSELRWHHDIEPMPNGNFLLNTRLTYTHSQAVGMGRNPHMTPEFIIVEPIVEVKPNGTKGGDIVWMWNPADHMVQDFDASKPNYGAVEDHPELIDFNYPRMYLPEWQHSNSVAYNAELDQVMITNRFFDEFWVIDHNTTTEEAAGHTGGGHGKGGDLLYRWGNPQAYGRGDASDRVLFGPHDAHWVEPGLPGEGNVIVFNNGNNIVGAREDGNYSSVEELALPVNATGCYYLAAGSTYGPSEALVSYTASPPEDFFANSMGGVERLPDGNTLVAGGSTGYNFEVDSENEVVWEYESQPLFKMGRTYPPRLDVVPALEATEDLTLVVDVSSHISDLDTSLGDLVMGTTSPYANVSGHELQLVYPDGITTDLINLTVSDGIFEVGRSVIVNITPVNDPPELASIPCVAAVEDVPLTLDLAPFVSDPDTPIDVMDIKEDSPYVTAERGKLRFLYPEGVLTDVVHLVLCDGEFEDRTEILVNITPVNDPPTMDPVPDQVGVEDVPWTIDLGTYVRDIDTAVGSISIASDSRYTEITGLNITLEYPDGVTSDVVMLTVTDGESALTVGFNVTIEPVNDPPVIEDIPPVTVTEDQPFSLDLGPAISDIDTPMGELTLRVDSPFIEVEGHLLIILYPDGYRRAEVHVELWDGELLDSATLVVNVEQVNDAPEIGEIPPLTVIEDQPLYLDIGPYILDIDTPVEELTLRVDSPFIEVEDHFLVLLYPDGVLQDEVVLEVWDGVLHASTTLVVNVEPVNSPPRWAAQPEISAVEDVAGEFDLGPYVMDVDTPHGELVVEADSSHGWMEGHVFRFNYPNGVLSEQVTFTLTDGGFRVVVRLNVTVSPVNDPPELSRANVAPPKGVAGTSFKFTVVLKDIDMGTAESTVEVVVDGVAHRCVRDELDTGSYDDGVVFILEMEMGPGIHTFHFRAEDGDGGAVTTEPLSVTVKETPGISDVMVRAAIMTFALIVAAVALVAILRTRRRGSSGPPTVQLPR